MKIELINADKEVITHHVAKENDELFTVITADGESIKLKLLPDLSAPNCGVASINNQNYPYAFNKINNTLQLWVDGEIYEFEHPEKQAKRQTGSTASGSGSNQIIAPMPGKVLQVKKAVGDAVAENETVIIMESMKMEMSLNASTSGTIKKIAVKENDMVEQNTVLVKLISASEKEG